MFLRHNVLLALAATALAAVLAGCGAQSQPPPASQPAQAVKAETALPRDDLGREVKLASSARRVAVLGPGAAETIFALGAGERIVGRDSGADFPASIKKVPVVADYRGLFVEACVAARPDLVLVQGETWGRERVEAWQKKIGAPVAALAPTSVEAVQQNADKIAAWLGVEKRDLKLAQALGTPSAGPKLSAFVDIGGGWTAGRGTMVADVLARGGLENVAADVDGYKLFSKETLLARSPDLYVTAGQPAQKARVLASLRSDPALRGLKCVREGQVLVLPSDFLLRPGPRLRSGILFLQKAGLKAGASKAPSST